MSTTLRLLEPCGDRLVRAIEQGYRVAVTRKVMVTLLHPHYISGGGFATEYILVKGDAS